MVRIAISLLLLHLIPLGSRAETKVFSIYFTHNNYDLDSAALLTIDSINHILAHDQVSSMYIMGYCNDLGSDSLNNSLSQNRADAVAARLSSTTILQSCQGRGSIILEPKSETSLDDQRSQNRRAEVTIHYTPKTPDLTLDHIPAGQKIRLDNLHFEGSRHILVPDSEPILQSLYQQLKTHPKVKIQIQGHICCSSDEDGFDLDTRTNDLSVQRAKMVYDYLVSQGIDSSRLSYQGFGSKYRTAASNPLDRRVEIMIMDNSEARAD